jgi:tRNA pseudouridine38-40 synthase
MTRRIKAVLEYDGTDFCGWQRQTGAPTIQEAVETALAKLFQKQTRVTSAGRTDAGVHALGQVISFLTDATIPVRGILRGSNSLLPETIRIVDVQDAPLSFNPRHDAILRWYQYAVMNRTAAPAIERLHMAHVPYRLDNHLLSELCKMFVGTHDFAGFRSVDCGAKRTRLTLETFQCQRQGDIVTFDLRCRSFLQNMVRILVGGVIEATRGKIQLSLLREMLKSGHRDSRVPTAPACGLTLMRVYYPGDDLCFKSGG